MQEGKFEMLEEPFEPKYIYWELCDSCNLKCKQCFANSGPEKSFFQDKDLLVKKIAEIEEKKAIPIRFGGGEPLLHPQLFEILEECSNIGVPVAITTNGTLLDAERAHNLAKYNIRSLTISIDGTEEYNDYLRGRGAYIRACQGLENALSQNIKVSLAFTVTAMNYKNLPAYVYYFYAKGVREFYIFRYIPNEARGAGKALNIDNKVLKEVTAEIQQLEKNFSDVKFHYEKFGYLAFLLNNDINNVACNFTKGTMTIKSNGDVIVCAAISKILGNIYKDELKKIYGNIMQEIEAMHYIPKECFRCVFAEGCRGGCKSYSFAEFGNYYHKDDCCYKNIAH